MKGVILAAGDGTRLNPFTLDCPKPLARVHNRPLIAYTLEAFAQVGLNDLVMVVGYKADMVMAALGDEHRYGLRLTYVHNPDYQLRNASSVYAARPVVGDEPFILTMADHMISPDILLAR